jgi:biotin operon repressor
MLDDQKVQKLHLKGKSLREIAAALGCSHTAVRKALQRLAFL